MRRSSNRIQQNKDSLLAFLATYLILAVLTTIQVVILDRLVGIQTIPTRYAIVLTIYWLVVAAIFVYVVQRQIKTKFENPMRRLADATRKVANGDFSIYVKPTHTGDKLDYIDRMIINFNKMVEELGSIETLRTDFFSDVSHEIKTPLSVIQNYANALQNDSLTDEERQDYTDTIINASKKLSELITNFLKLSKLENQKIQPITDAYDVCRQLAECAVQFEDIWEGKQIDFQTDLEDSAMVDADASLMELVWNNLLSNAFKFTPAHGTVQLTQTSHKGEIVVTVTDSGIGMDEETMQHIFEKFYQGDSSHSTEGNGLGLSLVLRVLQIEGGSVTVSSEPDKGSTFTVHMPIAKSELAEGQNG